MASRPTPACRTENGRIIWKRDMLVEMGGSVGGWLYSESVLVLDNLAFVTPGGNNAISRWTR